MGSATLAQKILARAAGREAVLPGEIHVCRVDLAMVHDSSGPRRQAPKLAAMGAGLHDPERVVVITDHFVTERDPASLAIGRLTRRWVREHGVTRFHEAEGICHVVLPEAGHLRPGMLVVGGDSHSTTGGAFGCMMVGIGATEMAGVLATGEIWLKVPGTVRVEISGRLPSGVAAKDVALELCARVGGGGLDYLAVEFEGEAVHRMPVEERMVLTNMAAELGAKAAMVAADAATVAWLGTAGVAVEDAGRWRSDPGAALHSRLQVDASSLSPRVAAPHAPDAVSPLAEHAGTRVDQAYLGACTGAKLEDLRMAARVLEGRRVADGVALYVAPASRRGAERARAEGTLDALLEAGARVLPTGCGACIGLGPAALGAGRTQVSSTSRNFRARMGHVDSRTFLASPYAVAAAAVTGRITDPRDLLGDAPGGAPR